MTGTKITDTSSIIRKANQIAAFFEAYPQDRAVNGVAEHINKFWSPPMRKQLHDYIAQDGGTGLNGLVIEAREQVK